MDNKIENNQQQMNIVVIGHVDHGKSTVVGRLLADTKSLPQGKLQQVKDQCKQNARPFEYAFLLDALKDEQDQGITIDSARCFFKSKKREYIIIDAPGHIEFLKNMISGAARAEAAVLVIDALEGVRENSRRHGYLLSMLGIKQVIVVVNKLDLVEYSQDTFEKIKKEYSQFLHQIETKATAFIPASAREGVNIIQNSEKTPWYSGQNVLEGLDSFKKELRPIEQPLRLPIQDIYKFTQNDDNRRIFAGQIETGKFTIGDEVIFLPSEKKSTIATIEEFNATKQTEATAGESIGVTLTEQIYVQPGELMCKTNQHTAQTGTQIKTNIFWMGTGPMIKGKRYKLKIASARIHVWLREIITVLDASDLTTDSNRQQIERHDVAECVLETLKPIAFDITTEIAQTSRFVIIDNYEIAGGGVILDKVQSNTNRIAERVEQREKNWERSKILPKMRSTRYDQRSTLVLITGPGDIDISSLAKKLEENLFAAGRSVYYLGIANTLFGVGMDINDGSDRDEYIRRLGEISHLFTDAGLILITTVSDMDEYELDMIKKLNHPNDCRVITVGQNRLTKNRPDIHIPNQENTAEAIEKIKNMLVENRYFIEYYL